MTKARFSISVDVVHADRIKMAAAHAGLDVSAYMWRAAIAAADRDEQIADVFAVIDAQINDAERAESDSWPSPPVDDDLSDAEKAAIADRWNAFFNSVVA